MNKPGTGLRLTRDVAKVYASRGGMAIANLNRWPVDGEYLCAAEVGKRIGVSRKIAQKRMRRILNKQGALTWPALRLEKQS